MKQAILVRTDLKMKKGKIAAQSCHASLASFLKSEEKDRNRWIEEGMKKVVLKVKDEKELSGFFNKAKKAKLPCEIIIDKGLTQVKSGTKTSVGIGPAPDRKIDSITGKLKLL